jgi:hypothetical protein
MKRDDGDGEIVRVEDPHVEVRDSFGGHRLNGLIVHIHLNHSPVSWVDHTLAKAACDDPSKGPFIGIQAESGCDFLFSIKPETQAHFHQTKVLFIRSYG